jgi:hypothetical protein
LKRRGRMKGKTWITAAAVIGIAFFLSALPLSGASAREEVKLEMWSAMIGVPAYQASLTLSEMLKAKHPWLRISPVEGHSFANVHAIDAFPLERKKYCLLNSLFSTEYTRALLGLPPWKRKFTDLKVVMLESSDGLALGTYDPDIRTPQDLRGKKIGLFPKRAAPNEMMIALMKDAWGILDTVKLSYHRPMAMQDMLVTKVVDAVYGIVGVEMMGGKFGQTPFTANILAARKTYWINATPEDIAKVNAKNPWKAGLMKVSKDALGPGKPPEDTGLISGVMGILAWDKTPENVVYELVKFVDENAQEWSKRLRGRRMDHGSIIAWPGLTEDMVHPGALKYYKEKGIKIGR